MDTTETILTTRAMRRFTDEPVADADLETCLRAAQQAPSGGNVQPVQYGVVTDPDQRALVAHWHRTAFDGYESSRPARTPPR
ncbi:MAG: nitroreductase family protein [Ilumatobacteraceae bacterium]